MRAYLSGMCAGLEGLASHLSLLICSDPESILCSGDLDSMLPIGEEDRVLADKK